MNAEFQRTARRDKKAILRDHCKYRKTIEWERLEISSRKSEISREHFMQRWAQKKDRNGMDLTKGEDIQKTWQEYTEKNLHDPDNHNGVITHLRARHPGM